MSVKRTYTLQTVVNGHGRLQFVCSRLNAPVELPTRYTTPDTTVDGQNLMQPLMQPNKSEVSITVILAQ